MNRAAAGDPQCENHEFRVFDRVDDPVVADPVVADPDPPQVWISHERSSAGLSSWVSSLRAVDGRVR